MISRKLAANSPGFHSIALAAVMLVLAVAGAAEAQGTGGFYGSVTHQGGDLYGREAYTFFGGTQFFLFDGTDRLLNNGSLLFSGQLGATNFGDRTGSFTAMRRFWLTDDSLLGLGAGYDINENQNQDVFQETVISLELLRDDWSVRSNAYLPVGPRVRNVATLGNTNDSLRFEGNNIVFGTNFLNIDNVAMKGIDVELARSIGDWTGEAFVGYYNHQGRIGGQTHGIKGGVRGYVTPRLAGNITISDDPLFGTNVYGGFTWFFGGNGGNAPQTIEDKLTIPVERNQQVVINQVQTVINTFAILTDGGQPILVMHANDSGMAGDGSFELPHGSLTAANADPNKANRDITYVYSNTMFLDQSYTAAPNQRVLGEGDNNQHVVQTDQLGPIILPESNPGANSGMLPRPIIQAPDGMFAFNAANGSEISNLNITNMGNRGGVFAGGLAGNVNVNRTLITGGVVGVDVGGSSGQIDLTEIDFSNVQTSLLANNIAGNINIDQSMFLGGTTGIDIIGGTGQFTFTDTTITDPTGAVVNVNGGTAGINFDGTSQISQSTPAGTGLQFSAANGIYDFTGQVTLNGGDAGIDILGGSGGTFTFTNTDITNPTGEALLINGGSADVTFNSGSTITKDNAGTTIDVLGGHTGTLTFDNGSTISATGAGAGDGLQFDNADGDYDFSGQVTLNGGDAGIDILGGSEGTFTFTDTTITDPSGTAFNVDGSTADVNYTGGSISQGNNATAFNVDTHSTGTLDIDVDITSTNGNGLQFSDADGTYDFSGQIDLSGGDVGIDIITGSAGTFTFSGLTTINNASGGRGVNIDGGAGQAAETTFSGGLDITTSGGGTGLFVDSSGLTTVSPTAGTESIDSTGGPAVDINNTQVNMTFDSISATNSAAEGIDIDNALAGSTFEVTGTTTINGTGLGFSGIDIDSSAGTFTFSSVDIDNTGADGVTLNGNSTTAVNINGGTIDGTADDGVNSTNTEGLTVDGVAFGGTTTIGDDAIQVVNNDATMRTVTLQNNTSAATADITSRGIFINSSGTGMLTANIAGNDIKSTDHALEVLENAGAPVANTVDLAIDLNTFETGTGVPTVEVTGQNIDADNNSVNVNSLNANTIVANGTGGGALFTNVTFDATKGDAVQQVLSTGITNIGQNHGGPAAANQRVQGDGLSLINPVGDLAFTTLNIANDGGGDPTAFALEADTKGAGTNFNLATLAASPGTIDSMGGGGAMFLDPLTGDLNFATVIGNGGVNGIFVDALTATNGVGNNALTIGTLDIDNTTGDGVVLQNNGPGNFNIGTTGGAMITDAGGDGIELNNNAMTTAITFGDTTIDLGATAGTAGINYTSSNGPTTFGTTIITDVGNAANQVGIDFNGATLSGTAAYDSVAISGPDTSTSSIGVDLTGLAGNQIVNLGSQVMPNGGPSSSITDLHRGVVIDNTAAVQFTFGDGEDTADIASSINVNGQAGAFTVDAGGGTLAASSFNFDDVTFGAGDTANFPAAAGSAIFVSTAGGLVNPDANNGLSQAVNTISVLDALNLVDPTATFAFVGTGGVANTIDVTAGGATGFLLDAGQSIDGFLNGNMVSFGQLQPANVTGNFGVVGGNVTGNSAVALNNNGAATSVVTVTENSTVENNIFDGAGTVTSLIDVSGATLAATLNAIDLQNIGAGDAGVNLNGNSAAVMLMDVDLVGTNAGTALQIDALAASTAQITADAASDIDGTTGTVVSIGAGARDINLSAMAINANNNTSNVIDVTGQTAGTIMFGDVDITGFNNAGGTAVNLQGVGGTVSFTDLDITTTAGAGLSVGAITFAPGATPTINTTNGGAGNALTMNGTTLSGGAATFDSITASGGGFGIALNNTTGTTTVTTVDIDGSAGAGVLLTGADTVAINGGTIDGTTGDGIFSSDTNLTISGVNLGGTTQIGGDGIDIDNNTANATVAIDNTTVNAAGDGINVDGTGFLTTVTSLSGNTVTNATGSGMSFEDVTFDASPGGAPQQVAGGNTTIGNLVTTTNINGNGLRMNDVLGRIGFGTLDIGNDNGTGLFIRDAGGKGGTFAFSNTGGTINTTNGAAMDIDPVAMNSTFASVSSSGANNQGSGGNNGINLDTISGTVDIQGGSITGATGDSFRINGGTASVTYSGGITHATAGQAAVSVTGGHNAGTVTFNTGTISATDGTGLQFNNADGIYNFNGQTTLGSGDAGVDIVNGSAGTFTFVNTDITSPTGTGINIDGGSSSVSFQGTSSLVQANNAAAVTVQGGHTGSLTYAGTANATNGTGLQFNNADGTTYSFNGVVTLSGGDAGIDIVNGSNASFTFSNTSITSPTGSALNVDSSQGAINWTAGTITQANNATAVRFNNHSGGIVTLGGTISATNGDGLQFSNADGTYNLNGQVTLNGGDAGVDILSGSGGTFTFVNTDITSPTGTGINIDGGSSSVSFQGTSSLVQANNAAAVMVQGGHTGSLTYAGTANATNGTGLQFNNADGTTYSLNGVVTLSGGDAGIDIVNGSSASFTFSNTTITNPTGEAFNVDGSSGGITYSAGSITKTNNADEAVRINNHGGGIVTLNPSITGSTGAANAIDLIGANTGTYGFGGVLDLDTTTGIGLNATGGGNVNVTGAGNTVSTNGASAAGVNIANTTIGGSGVTFESVNVSGGATNGIVLNNAGSGGFTVTGVGASTSAGNRGNVGASAGTGGTINNATAEAVSIVNTDNVALNSMDLLNAATNGITWSSSTGLTLNNVEINNAGNQGVDGLSVVNFTMANTEIRNIGNANEENGLDFGESAGSLQGLTGTATISDSIVDTVAESGMELRNFSGSLNMTISNTRFANNQAGAFGEELILFSPEGSAQMTVKIDGNSEFVNARNQAIDATIGALAADTALLNLTVDNVSFNNYLGADGMIKFESFGAGESNLSVLNSMFTPVGNGRALFIKQNNNGDVHATIKGNTITGNDTANFGRAIEIVQDGDNIDAATGNMFIRIGGPTLAERNTITGYELQGIFVDAREPTSTADIETHIIIENNHITMSTDAGAFPASAIRVDSRFENDLIADILSNVVVTSANGFFDGGAIVITRQPGGSGASFALKGIGGAMGDAEAIALLNLNNTLPAGQGAASFNTGVPYTNATPTEPTPTPMP